MNMQNKTFCIGNHLIGAGKTFVVAEIGSNHNQDLTLAYEMIDAAKECGADAVKFQAIGVDELYYKPSIETRKLHKRIDMDEGWHSPLKAYADRKDILFFASPTYLKAVDVLESIQVQLYKLASAQIGTFPQLVRKVAMIGKPVLLSTGLVSYGDLERVVRVFHSSGNGKFVILHCNSIYPTPYDKVNLDMMNVFRIMFNQPVGFSDHTLGIYVPIAAVGLGASVIEKHFTIDRKIKTPDSEVSLDEKEFGEMVKGIRTVEQSLAGERRVEIDDIENEFKEKIVHRLVLRRRKKRGDIFQESDFQFKRCDEGIDCRYVDIVVNHFKSNRDIRSGDLLGWSDLEGN